MPQPDASDRLILDLAADDLATTPPDDVVVIGSHGLSAARVFNDDDPQSPALDAALVNAARLVLMQLPKSLAELDEVAATIAASASPDVVVYAAGRIKHMSREMNAVLARHFGSVTASLAQQKSRALVASVPLPGTIDYPKKQFHEDLDLWVCAHGGAFAGTKVDIGTRFLLTLLGDAAPDARTAIDLGCGTGILAATIARDRPGLQVIATDRSWAAVASAQATMSANGLGDRVHVVRDSGLSTQPDASADLVLLNPPFHARTTVDTDLAAALFRDAARVLVPGGELWTVFNSSLGYRPALEKIVGSTRQVARNNKFTVTASRRR